MQAVLIRVALVALVLLIPGAVVAPVAPAAWAASSDVQESVTGHADFVTATGIRFRYSLSAVRHADGSVSGEFENHVENAVTGQFILIAHVNIVCFTVTGNVARVGGIVERQIGGTTGPGAEGFITVVDNGEGSNGVPDLASPPGVAPGSAFAHCETGLPRPLFPIERGNIQVRPAGS
jgi:hypothetical protein